MDIASKLLQLYNQAVKALVTEDPAEYDSVREELNFLRDSLEDASSEIGQLMSSLSIIEDAVGYPFDPLEPEQVVYDAGIPVETVAQSNTKYILQFGGFVLAATVPRIRGKLGWYYGRNIVRPTILTTFPEPIDDAISWKRQEQAF